MVANVVVVHLVVHKVDTACWYRDLPAGLSHSAPHVTVWAVYAPGLDIWNVNEGIRF